MAVRRTETVIPGGFARAHRLGFAQVSPDQRFALVSYLGEDWPMGRTETGQWFSIPNRYVLFVDTNDLEWVNQYRWEATALDRAGQEVWRYRKSELTTQIGVFNLMLTPDHVAELIHDYANTLHVTVQPLDADGNSLGEPLTLVHRIRPLAKLLEAHLSSSRGGVGQKQTKDKGKGNETSTRIVGNYFAPMIAAACAELKTGAEAAERTKSLLTSAVYQITVQHHGKWQRSFENSGLRNYLNGIFRFRVGFSQATGICGLLPYHFRGQTAESEEVVLAPISTAISEADAFRHFNGLKLTDQIDIYNVLRFPLAHIRAMARLLAEELPAKRPDWLPKEWDEIEDVSASRYVKALGFLTSAKAELPDYRVFPIQVRDIRSGMPIRQAAVSRLEIIGSGNEKSTRLSCKFDAPARRLEVRNLDLVYDQVLDQYGQSSAAYWEQRRLPDNSNKQYAVHEYLAHAQADSSGTVEVMVPQAFLAAHAEVRIRIGFHYFPIVSNEWKAGEEVIVTSAGTGLKVEWIGDRPAGDGTANNVQSKDWSENLVEDRHFGWAARHPRGGNLYPLRVGVEFTLPEGEADRTTPLVVYGMQWCQPVWAVVPETATHYVVGNVRPSDKKEGRVVSSTAIPLNPEDRARPFLVTRWNAGGAKHGGGRDYGCKVVHPEEIIRGEETHPKQLLTGRKKGVSDGLYYPPLTAPRIRVEEIEGSKVYFNKPHHGLDYHSVEGVSKVFALHGGKVSYKGSGKGGYGYCVGIGSFEPAFTGLYAHLHQPSPLVTGALVRAGTVVGVAGRSFYVGGATPKYDEGPTHLHLEIREYGEEIGKKILYADPPEIIKIDAPRHYPANRHLLLNNDGPRLLPCDCQGGVALGQSGSDCILRRKAADNGKAEDENKITVQDKLIPRTCWALRNLHCPYWREDSTDTAIDTLRRKFGTQARLSWIPPYSDLEINGVWGEQSKVAIRAFREKHAQEIFGDKKPPKDDSKWEELPEKGSKTDDKLNELAPYPRTDFTKPER